MALPAGEALVDCRDRAILKTFIYTGARLALVTKLDVSDFRDDDEDPTLTFSKNGRKGHRIGIHPAARTAIREYVARSGLTAGPLFRPRLGPRS